MIGPSLRAEIENTFQIAVSRCTAEELAFVCPECGDSGGNRSVNLRTGVTHCWRCGKGKSNKGNFLAWAKANGYSFSNSLDMVGMTVEEVLVEPESAKSRVPFVNEIPLPKGFVYLREEPKSGYAKLIGRMAVRKNLTLEDLTECGAGFSREGIWEPYCIFPVLEFGRVVYYQGRTYVDVPGETTKKFPSRNEVQHGASCWLYGFDDFYEREVQTVIVVEAILSVLSLRKKLKQLNVRDVVPLCVFKHSVSTIQLTKLFQCKWLKEICFMFDHDAVDTTWKQLVNIGNRTKLTIAEMPEASGNKKLDPNDDPDLAWKAFEERKAHTAGTVMDKLWVPPTSARDLSKVDIRKCIQTKPSS